jgi:hypothetical protein
MAITSAAANSRIGGEWRSRPPAAEAVVAGYGREGGAYGIDEYVEVKFVSIGGVGI